MSCSVRMCCFCDRKLQKQSFKLHKEGKYECVEHAAALTYETTTQDALNL